MNFVNVTIKWQIYFLLFYENLNYCRMEQNFYYQIQDKRIPNRLTLLRFASTDFGLFVQLMNLGRPKLQTVRQTSFK